MQIAGTQHLQISGKTAGHKNIQNIMEQKQWERELFPCFIQFFCCPCNTFFLSLWVPRVLATRALRSIDSAKNAWSLGLFNFITIHLDGRQWTHPSGFIRPITITTDTGRWWFPLNYLRLFLDYFNVFFPFTGGGEWRVCHWDVKIHFCHASWMILSLCRPSYKRV